MKDFEKLTFRAFALRSDEVSLETRILFCVCGQADPTGQFRQILSASSLLLFGDGKFVGEKHTS